MSDPAWFVAGVETVEVDGRRWWTRPQVAAYLGVQPATLGRYVRAGMPGPGRRDPVAGRPLWDPAAVVAWHGRRPGRGRWKESRV